MVGISIDLMVGKEQDREKWLKLLSNQLNICFQREIENDLHVALLFAREILFYPWSFGDEEEDYNDPELVGMEWISYALSLSKLHHCWHDLEVCVRRSFTLMLQEELKSRYGIRSQPFHDVQSRIHRGYGGVLPWRKYRGRDQERFPFGESVEVEAYGLSEEELVAAVNEFLQLGLVSEKVRQGCYLGMNVSLRKVESQRFVLKFERIPGVHPDDDLTFRMGLGLLLSDFLNKELPLANFEVRMANGCVFVPEDVPLCTEESESPGTSLMRS